jgi:hypothetical protein
MLSVGVLHQLGMNQMVHTKAKPSRVRFGYKRKKMIPSFPFGGWDFFWVKDDGLECASLLAQRPAEGGTHSG